MSGDTTQDRVLRWFAVKRQQLIAAADLPVCEHPGLTGGHREEFQRIYLSEILPQRFRVGRGMVYGQYHRSREADIVIWDADNYPSLPMLDHQFFFAESVRVVLESKSRYDAATFADVLVKAESVRDIVVHHERGLEDEIVHLKFQVYAMMRQDGSQSEGFMRASHHIAAAAVFLRGGVTFSLEDLDPDVVRNADDCFPDLMLFLEPGIVVVKNYGEAAAELLRFSIGEDCLAFWTHLLLEQVLVRTVNTEPVLNLASYLMPLMLGVVPDQAVRFGLTRMPAGRTPIFIRPGGKPEDE